MKKEIDEFKEAVKLIKNMIHNKDLDPVDIGNIEDWFFFKFIEVFESNDRERARQWVFLLQAIESLFTANEDFETEDGFTAQNYAGMFYAMAELLSLKYGVKMFADEKIDKKSFEMSFRQRTKPKLR